ncbi:MAG: hypothetical protein HDT43_07055 [Ruminococcaceae bacterium]|nr:hypothetical protein [Oscillospiraceae bacterium]
MLKVSFDNSDRLLQTKQILAANHINCENGTAYCVLLVDNDDKKFIAMLLKKEKVKCDISAA